MVWALLTKQTPCQFSIYPENSLVLPWSYPGAAAPNLALFGAIWRKVRPLVLGQGARRRCLLLWAGRRGHDGSQLALFYVCDASSSSENHHM